MKIRAAKLVIASVLLSGLAACAGGDPHAEAGFRALQKADYAAAEPELKQALAAHPGDAYATLNLGAVYQNTGRADLAVPLYREVLKTGANLYPTRTAGSATKQQSLADIARANLARIPGA